jgi:hypothetical protein
MLEFEEKWQSVVFIIITLIGLIYAVYMSVIDIRWQDRTWWQKLITLMVIVFISYIFVIKISK